MLYCLEKTGNVGAGKGSAAATSSPTAERMEGFSMEFDAWPRTC